MTENNKENSPMLPSDVIKEVATENGWEEMEYKKENGIKPDGTIYQSQSWIGRKQNIQKEITINYLELKPKIK